MVVKLGLAAGLVIALGAGACGSTHRISTSAGPAPATTTTTTTTIANTTQTQPGYREVLDTAGGYEITLPLQWRSYDLDSPGGASALSAVLAQNPQVASMVGGDPVAWQRAGVHLFAVGAGGSDANVVIRPAPAAGAGLDSLLPGLRAQLGAVKGAVMSSDHVSVNGADALHVVLSLTSSGQPVVSDQYYLVDQGRMFVVTIHAPEPTVAAIVATFRFTS